MPTPRFYTEVARQVRLRAGSSASASATIGAWIPGVIVDAGGDIENRYQVQLDTGVSGAARSTLDFALVVGSLVFITVGPDGEYLIVGMQ